MTFEQIYVTEKLKFISDHIKESQRFFRFSEEEILNDSEKMHVAERLFQLIVDAMIDINQYFIKEMDLGESADFQGTFYILGENNVLPEKFAFKIAPVAAVRNRLVHGYETLNKKLFISNFRGKYSDFLEYAEHIRKHLEKTVR